MKPGIPWSVKGIEGRAREVAKDAARAEGLTLGEWLNQKILESAQEDAELKARATRKKAASSVARRPAAKPRARSTDKRNEDDAVTRKLDELFDRIASLQASPQPAYAASENAPAIVPQRAAAIPDNGASVHAMEQLLDRIENGEKRTHDTLDDLGNRVDRLGDRVEEIADRSIDIKARDIPGFSALEGAVRNIVDHIAKSETQSRETMTSLQTRLADISGRVENPEPGSSISPELVTGLEKRISQLAAQVESVAGTAGGEELKQIFEARIRELAERIDTVRHSAETLGQKAEATASKAAREQAQAIEQRLSSLVGEAERRLAESGTDEKGLAEIHAEIGKLNNRFEDIRKQAASEHEVQALRSALEKLSTRVEEVPGQEPIGQIEERIAELSQQLQAVAQPVDLQPQIGHLEQRIQALDSQLASASATATGPDQALAAQISNIENRLSSTEQQLGSLGTIEDSIQQLFASLEQSRAETRELISGTAANGTGAAADSTTSSEMQALQDGLAAVRANAEAADQRTQETLEAVHETLAQIIDKLSELENDGKASGQVASVDVDEIAASAAAAAAAMAAVDQPQQAPAAQHEHAPSPSVEFSPFGDLPSAGSEQPAPAVAQPEAAAPAPAKAGSQEGDWLSVVRAHMTQNHGGSAYVPSASPGDAGSAGHVDFIAAARRAAASAVPVGPAGATLSAASGFGEMPGSDDAGAQQGRLASLLSRKAGRSNEVGSDGQHQDKASSRKRLMLAALVLLTAVSAYAANSGMLFKSQPQQTSFDQSATTPQVQPVQQAEAPVLGKVQLPVNAAPVELPSTQVQAAASPTPSTAGPAPSGNALADPITTASIAPGAGDPMLLQQPSPAARPLAQAATPAVQLGALPQQIGTAELRNAAANGDAKAQFIVASRFLEGRTIGRDHEAAARWYTQAANGGLSAAQYRIGTLYERGSGVPQDKFQAMAWYAKAAEQGNVKAMHNLAVLSADSTNGKPDMERAAKWFAAAAAHGLPDSQYNLAVLHERGLGVEANASEAYKWYQLAARQGDRDAIKKADALKAKLGASAMASIDQLVATWKPRPADRDANMVSVTNAAWGLEQNARQASAAPSAGQRPMQQPMNAKPVETLSAKDQVRLAQQLLAQKGFDPGVADGQMGSGTANAIRLYQLRNGLPVNGSLSRQLLDHLQQGTI